ncbi:hypothetical protein Tco_1233829, partial [Tanacetum coccineum]
REFRSSRKLFNTPSLDESSSPEFDLFSDLEEHFEEEVAKTMAETMEEYMCKTRGDNGSGVTRQMSKVLQERGFQSLPSSTETNPMDHVKSISTAVETDMTSIRRIGSSQYAISA